MTTLHAQERSINTYSSNAYHRRAFKGALTRLAAYSSVVSIHFEVDPHDGSERTHDKPQRPPPAVSAETSC